MPDFFGPFSAPRGRSMSAHIDTDSLLGKALEETGHNYLECYQCGKCTAGCPLRHEMDIPVSEIVRLIQRRDKDSEERALRSQAIWVCLSCETCSARCPQEVHPADLMDFCRHESYDNKMVSPEGRRILQFHKAFLDSVKASGRIYEIGMIVKMKMGDAFHLDLKEMMRYVFIAPTMLLKGKLPIFGHHIKGTDEMARIFERCLGSDK